MLHLNMLVHQFAILVELQIVEAGQQGIYIELACRVRTLSKLALSVEQLGLSCSFW